LPALRHFVEQYLCRLSPVNCRPQLLQILNGRAGRAFPHSSEQYGPIERLHVVLESAEQKGRPQHNDVLVTIASAKDAFISTCSAACKAA
jgi:hypothetical protein